MRGDGFIYSLDYGDGFMGEYLCPNLSFIKLCTLNSYGFFCMSIIPLLKIIKNKKIKMSYTWKFLKAKDEKIEDKW